MSLLKESYKEDIDMLKSMGKNHIFIMELDENTIHEEAAARITKAAVGEGIYLTEPSKGNGRGRFNKKGLSIFGSWRTLPRF